jgi:hypothetical protein
MGSSLRRLLPALTASFLASALLVSATQAAPANARGGEEEAATMDEAEAEFDEIEVLKKKAATEGDWALAKEEQISVNQRVLTKPWNKVPFDTKAFDMTPEQIKDRWPVMMRALQVPYPSAEYLKTRIETFPAFKPDNFDGDYEKLSREILETWRLFFRGDYQAAMNKGINQGPAGMIPGKVSQLMYAVYLEPSLDDKHMLLQDVANVVREYGSSLDKMKQNKEFHDDYVIIRIGYSYAIGRIAEDVPIPVAISRNYVFKVLDAANDVLKLQPDSPLGLAFRAGIDANVVRKVGKATGRVTFGAKQTDVKSFFERSLKQVPDVAVIRYEYGNALLYMDKKRQIEAALEQFKLAAGAKPNFSMEALDSMYAAKRRKEIEALAKSPVSFRSFERRRLKHQKQSSINLYCVLPQVCPPYLVSSDK